MAVVLVVEDEDAVGRAIEWCLARAGHQVQRVGCGNCALEAIQKSRFDLVLTDVLMPKKDGIEFVQEARQLCPQMPIIVVSGGGQIQSSYYLRSARLMGATAALAKPFTAKELTQTVAAVLNGTHA